MYVKIEYAAIIKIGIIKEALMESRNAGNDLGEKHKMATKIKSKKEKKKQSVTIEKNRKKKLLKIGIPIALVLLIVTGLTLFILKSGIFFGKSTISSNQENRVANEQDYAQAQTYYAEGSNYDASALFTLFGDYENSEEMLKKIDLENLYTGNGIKIAEYIGSDVVNNYICIINNYNDINTVLAATEKTTEQTAAKTTEETDKTTEAAKKSEETIKYDETTIATVKEKTNEMIAAGNRVKALNLNSNNVLYAASETLKKSADYNNQVAQKIQEGVKAGTYQPDGSDEITQEIKTLVENMSTENNSFVTQIETIISDNSIDIVHYSKSGTCLKRYLESISNIK